MIYKIALTVLLTGISCNAFAMQSLFEALAPAAEIVGTRLKEQFEARFKESPLVLSLRQILHLANRENLPEAEVAKIRALIASGRMLMLQLTLEHPACIWLVLLETLYWLDL